MAKTSHPPVKFIIGNTELEANYICFLAKGITSGIYQKAGIPILPYPTNKNSILYFPDLDYTSRFWQVISRSHSTHYSHNYPTSCVDEVKSKLHSEQLSDASKFISEWRQIEQDFFNWCDNTLSTDSLWPRISSINILLTTYGTRGSFYSRLKQNKYTINLTARLDISSSNITRTLLLAIYRIKNIKSAETGTADWSARNASVDFLLKHSKLNDLLDHNIFTDKINSKVFNDNKTYLEKLGFPDKELQLNTNIFTKQEEKLYSYLVNNSGRTITYDEIGNVLWNNDDKFSLYAISKIIEGIREKIRNQGVSGNIIITKRGKGYLINN